MAKDMSWFKLIYTLTGPGGAEPRRSMAGDVGYDLFIAERTTIQPGQFGGVPHHVAVQLPPGSWAMIHGRSSALRNRGLMVMPGIIDNGYRGDLLTGVWNLTPDKVTLEVGERVSQLLLFPMMTPPVEHSDALSPTDRGQNGFGSTGR